MVHSSIVPKGANNCLTSSSVCCLLSMPTNSFRSPRFSLSAGFTWMGRFIPGNVCFSCRAFWALSALSGLKYVRNAQPVVLRPQGPRTGGRTDDELARFSGYASAGSDSIDRALQPISSLTDGLDALHKKSGKN